MKEQLVNRYLRNRGSSAAGKNRGGRRKLVLLIFIRKGKENDNSPSWALPVLINPPSMRR